MRPAKVLDRRRREREALLARARRFAAALPDDLGTRAVVVFGSVARGDVNLWSDLDVLVIADDLPERPLELYDRLGAAEALASAVLWTPHEWHRELARRNPIAVEARDEGVWLVGEPPAYPDV